MNELDKQWQEDVDNFGKLAYLMWEYLGINGEWIDVPSPESMAVLPFVRRKESAALDFDLAAAMAGDAVEVFNLFDDYGWHDVKKINISENGLAATVFYVINNEEIKNIVLCKNLRMKHPRYKDAE